MGKPLQLEIKSDDEITLPAWIGGTKLSLNEIGALAVIQCLQTEFADTTAHYFADKCFWDAVKQLQDRGLVYVALKDNSVGIKVDLFPISPANTEH